MSGYNDVYLISNDWNGNAHYKSGNGKHFYHYDASAGGVPSWSFDHNDQTGSAFVSDYYDGGWISHASVHPPSGELTLHQPRATITLSCQAFIGH